MKYTTCVYKYTPQRYLFDENHCNHCNVFSYIVLKLGHFSNRHQADEGNSGCRCATNHYTHVVCVTYCLQRR